MEYLHRRYADRVKQTEVESGLCLQPLSEAMLKPGIGCGWAAMDVDLPGHGKCVCIVFKPAFELLERAVINARERAAQSAREFSESTGAPIFSLDCKAQIAIDGATHRAAEKKTVIFGGWIGKLYDRDRRRICCNYNGLFKLVCEGESMNAAALCFEVGQRASNQILGRNLSDYARNVLKDDARGLEAGLLWQIEESGERGARLWGNIVSELFHRRKNLRRVYTPLIGKDAVDMISTGMDKTANACTSMAEFHVF